MANDAANAALTSQIEMLRTLPDKLQTEAAGIAVTVLDRELTRTINAGTDPDGKAWQKTKDGNTPLRNARKAVTLRRVGSGVLVQLTGPEALHHLGKAKGEIVRRVIPVGRLPDSYARALRTALAKRFVQLAAVGSG